MDKLITQNNCPIDLKKMNLLKKITDKFSDLQISWLSGYFWNIANKNFKKNKLIFKNNFFLTIISASQTGNAREISEKLYKKCILLKIPSKLFNADEYNFKKIINERFLILIVSTQGEGEVPDNSLDFYNFLTSNRCPKLHKLKYAIFALGDSSYRFFCKAGKDFEKVFTLLGCKSLLPRIDSDIEYYKNSKIWIKKLLNLIVLKYKHVFKNQKEKKINKLNNYIQYTKRKPFESNIIINKKISGDNSNKEVRHIEIDLLSSKIKYKPGDYLGIWYENNSSLILDILKLLNIKKNYIINYNGQKLTILKILKKYFELTVNTFNITLKYFNFLNNRYINLLKYKSKKIKMYSKIVPLIDMIYYFPVKITAEELINILRPLQPRLYSISSSQSEVGNEVHITVSLIKYFYNNKFRFGGSSFYLTNLTKQKKINIYVLSNKKFRLPKNKDIDIIMISAGTGIAPFRSFMQERNCNRGKGRNWIFFGNQTFSEDFLYQLEWQKYFKSGLLNRIDLAFSRDNHTKEKYIYEKIILRGKYIWEWIQNGAYIYVCGNIKTIGKSSEKSLLKIFKDYGNMNINDSLNYLNKLRYLKRYQRDVY